VRNVVGSVFIIRFRLGQRAYESSYSTSDEGRPFQFKSQFAGVAVNVTPEDQEY